MIKVPAESAHTGNRRIYLPRRTSKIRTNTYPYLPSNVFVFHTALGVRILNFGKHIYDLFLFTFYITPKLFDLLFNILNVNISNQM